jgi:murein DD-endopeptidase MepM/ murein hydrolase activator NlpD
VRRLAGLLGVLLVAVAFSLFLHRPALSATWGNTTTYEANNANDPYSSCTTGPTCNVASPWWSGSTFGVSQRYGCTAETLEPDNVPPNSYCPFPYNAKWHQGIDVLVTKATTLYSPVSGSVVDSTAYTTCIDFGCPLGLLGIRTLSGNVVYLLHGSPTSTFARVGQNVNVGDAVYTTGGNGYSTGYHLHFEVHSSIVGQLSVPTGPGDDLNPEPWFQYQGPRAAAVSWGTNRLDTFIRGSDGNVYHKFTFDDTSWNPSGTGNYDPMGSAVGGFAGQVSAASWGPNRLDLFGVDYNGKLWHRWWDSGPSWSMWENLSQAVARAGIPSLIGTPSAVSYAAGCLSVFVRASTGALIEVYYPCGSGWNWSWHEPAYLTTDPVAIAGPNRIDLVGYGRSGDSTKASGYSWHQSWTSGGSWSNLENWGIAGGGFVGQPAAASSSSRNIDVLAISIDGGLWDRRYNGISWGGWQQFTGSGVPSPSRVIGSPSATAWPGGGLFSLLVRGDDGALWDCWPTPATSTTCSWQSHGGQITNDPLVISAASYQQDVFVRAASPFYLAHQLFTGSGWSPCISGCFDNFGGVMA